MYRQEYGWVKQGILVKKRGCLGLKDVLFLRAVRRRRLWAPGKLWCTMYVIPTYRSNYLSLFPTKTPPFTYILLLMLRQPFLSTKDPPEALGDKFFKRRGLLDFSTCFFRGFSAFERSTNTSNHYFNLWIDYESQKSLVLIGQMNDFTMVSLECPGFNVKSICLTGPTL